MGGGGGLEFGGNQEKLEEAGNMYKAGEVEGEVGGISWENGKSAATCLGISRLMQGGCVPSKTHSSMSKKIFEEKNLLTPNPKLFSSLQSLSA